MLHSEYSNVEIYGLHLLMTMGIRECGVSNMENLFSLQCEDISLVEAMLSEHGIKWTSRVIEEGGIEVEQLFFHDPDGFMIEICTCEKLPVQPLSNGAIASLTGCTNPRMKCIANGPQRDDFSRASLHMLQAWAAGTCKISINYLVEVVSR